ncbi:hypothetical protein [uncultured Alistipes sp.]|uniref:hypothetical protein n=1 Tax=uncultured Alistipes sp. TaxID=538949 RepID=UPI00261324CA|nr:hypothetical protein [uncultured Alistipes sp.]
MALLHPAPAAGMLPRTVYGPVWKRGGRLCRFAAGRILPMAVFPAAGGEGQKQKRGEIFSRILEKLVIFVFRTGCMSPLFPKTGLSGMDAGERLWEGVAPEKPEK